MEVMVSEHADMRIKERNGLKSERRRQELAQLAYRNGLRLGNCDRKTEKLILSKKRDWKMDYVVYRDQLFIFEGNILVTMYPAEDSYRKKMESRRANEHRKERKMKKAA